jgi:hypothetical protein
LYIGGGQSDRGGENHAPMIMSTGNAERMRIAGNGNVGIGTNAPAYNLDVNGAARVSGIIHKSDITSGTYTIPGTGYISSGFFYQNANVLSGISETFETKSVWSRNGLLLTINGSFILRASSTTVSWGILKSTLGLTGYTVTPTIMVNRSDIFTNMSISENATMLILTANLPGTDINYCRTRLIILLIDAYGY